ncbi:hypothetical protein [Synechococcus sp. PCC 7336]|uniref:hypothetical protein n=1 Tax=Synechococcus sp. PCC 7336 TaxID=195250 RepID=UPI000570FA80|nr:hypothetical protein [Synechococcus sp. PCC 7336]
MSKITKSSLRKELLSELDSSLKEFGFKLVKSKFWFIKKTENRVLYYWPEFYSYPNKISIDPTVAIRFPCIEEIFHRASRYEDKYQKNTHTIVSEIWRINAKFRSSYECYLNEDIDISKLKEKLFSEFSELATAYFEKFKDVHDINSILNEFPDMPSKYQIHDFSRCSRGIIAAKLCNSPDFEKLINIYTQRMKTQDKGFYYPFFTLLVRILTA